MDSLKNIQDLVKSCLLPELKQDLDAIPLEEEHFKSYQECLRVQLPLLFDWIQQEPTKWLFSMEVYDETQQELQSIIIILLCELSSPKHLYHMDMPHIFYNCDRVLRKFSMLSEEMDKLIFNYYQEKLHHNAWKRQLGATHGFIKFLKFKYEHPSCDGRNMRKQFLMFCLSVGLNIRSCYETHYKYLSSCIFFMMLKHGNTDDINSTNIHAVIYDATIKEVHIMDSTQFINKQWNCLLKCFDFFTKIDSFTWSQVDESLELLLRYIPLAPDSKTSLNLLKFVYKIVVYFNLNRKEFENKLPTGLTDVRLISEGRELGCSNTSYTCFRWAKAILQVFILESYRLMQSADVCKEMLMEMHRCYLVAVLPIGLTIIENQLTTFFQKFTAVLMEVAKVQSFREDIMQAITSFLDTFCYQLQSCDKAHNLFKFKEAYDNLLKADPFKKSSLIK